MSVLVTALSHVVCCVCWPQYLACLKTSRSQTDKLSFDVGLQEDSTGKRKALIAFAFILLFLLFYSRWLCLSLSVCVFVPVSICLYLPLCTLFVHEPIVLCVFSAFQLILPVEHCKHTMWFFLSALITSLQHICWASWYVDPLLMSIVIYFILCTRWAVASLWLEKIVAMVQPH